jgi:hypothetical protein
MPQSWVKSSWRWTSCLNTALIPWSIPCNSVGRHADPAARRAELATEAAENRGICTDIALGLVSFLSGLYADFLLAGKAQAA